MMMINRQYYLKMLLNYRKMAKKREIMKAK